jgi:hypothetical protein
MGLGSFRTIGIKFRQAAFRPASVNVRGARLPDRMEASGAT